MKWRTRAVLVGGLSLLLGAAGCARCNKEEGKEADPARALADEPALPAPADLLADAVVPTPNASWTKLQRGIGGAAAILPSSLPGLVCSLAGIDPFAADLLDGTAPMFAAVGGDVADPGWAVAMKVTDMRKARAVLVESDVARFTVGDGGVLTPKGAPLDVAVGLAPSGYLIVARRAADLEHLGPYLTRTVAKKAAPAGPAAVLDVPADAIRGAIRTKLSALWAGARGSLEASDEAARKKHGGREPDFGDPKAIVGALDRSVTTRLAMLGEVDAARVELAVEADAVQVTATLTPHGDASKWVDGLRVGDVAELGALPAGSLVAISHRDDEGLRAGESAELAKLVGDTLGPRLKDDDRKRLGDALDGWAQCCGEVRSLAVAWEAPRGIVFRSRARDADAASRLLPRMTELAKASPFREMLKLKDATVSTEDKEGLGKVARASVTHAEEGPGKKRHPSESKPLGAASLVKDGTLWLAAGEDPVATIRRAAIPDKKLGDDPAIRRVLDAIGGNASTVVVAEPLRFDPKRALLPTAPFVIAFGRRGKNAFLAIDIANGLLREATRRQMGL